MKTDNILIAHPKNNEQLKALKAFMEALKIKFEMAKESPYDPEFVEKIRKSRKDFKEGKGTVMTLDELDALCK